jgi:hypothetical protein
MTARSERAERIAELVGTELLVITDPGTGWPALGTLTVDGERVAVALFVGAVGRSHRNRDDAERRFQNPGQDRPIVLVADRRPLLLGLLEEDAELDIHRPLLVQADPYRRIDRITRFSVFTSVTGLKEASSKGWSEHINSSGEYIRCFLPPLLPVSVAAGLGDSALPSEAMQAAINGSGLVEAPAPESGPAAERARRAATSLVRDARFSRRVINAYDGLCAMCGLDANLVQGAHIYPAAAPGSHDEPWNGLALCPNHHLAFDRHLLAVHPGTRKILISPDLTKQLQRSPAMELFVSGTFHHLAEPADNSARPSSEMLTKRYEYFVGSYEWMDHT